MDLKLKTESNLIKYLIILAICYFGTSVYARPRPKRQGTFQFHVISNNSFPCESVTSTTTQSGSSSLNDSPIGGGLSTKPISLTDDDLEMLTRSKRISSNTPFTARTIEEADKFPNILPISQKFQEKVREALLSQGLREKGLFLKSEIKKYLEDKESGKIVEKIREAFPFGKIGTASRPSHNDAHKVRKRQTSTSDSNSPDYCISRGAPSTDENYLRMCTTCSISTDLGKDFYPRFLNEATCSVNDSNCLVVGGIGDNTLPTNHGKCQAITMPLNFLAKNEGYCILALKNGQNVIVEDWVPVTKYISVGCECTVDSSSVFSYFV